MLPTSTEESLAVRLSFLGWTQQEIADKVRLTQQAVSTVTKNANSDKICNAVKSGKSISEVAKFYGLDIPVTWAIVLEDCLELQNKSIPLLMFLNWLIDQLVSLLPLFPPPTLF